MKQIKRRDFLRIAGVGAGGAIVGGGIYAANRDGSNSDAAPPTGPSGTNEPGATNGPGTTDAAAGTAATPKQPAASKKGLRTLVVIEMDGGNDGMSMVVPYGLRGYYDLRPRLAIPADEVITFDDEVGLHPSLARIAKRKLALVQGVGTPTPDGSHFEMMRRWWAGDASGSQSARGGFFGRVADAIGDPSDPAVAVTIGSGNHPALASAKVSTLALPSADAVGYLVGADNDNQRAFQSGFAAMNRAGGDSTIGGLRNAGAHALEFAGSLAELGDGQSNDQGDGYPDSDLGHGLRLGAQLLDAGVGVRIIHVPMHADFDTHDDHAGRYPGLMDNLDASLDALHADLERRGLADDVLVMTISEFGRTAKDNASDGLDHGAASSCLMSGPVKRGRYGEYPSLTTLDDNDDLVATVGFDRYYATVAERWFGVPAGDVLAGNPKPIDGLLA